MQHIQRHPILARAAATATLALTLTSMAGAQKLALRASLDGAQEVPPVVTTAVGTASAVIDLSANTLTFDVTFDGLSAAETNAHIHGPAAPGVSAGVKFGLPAGAKKVGVWNYPQSDEADILAGLMYVNIHSALHPAGEIRGQLVRDTSLAVLSATIDGLQEVPPTPSAGVGTGHVSVDTVANTLAFDITVTGLTSAESAAHIHGPAAAGANAGVKFALPLGSKKVGVWNYPQSDEAAILGGLMYINVHTANFGAGEVRGQILPMATNPTSYCTGKVTSLGCTSSLTSVGAPSASAGSGFTVTSAPVPGNNIGIFFYGKSGPGSNPFQGGFLCPAGQITRTPGSSSGGTTGVCNGAYLIDFNAFVALGSDPALIAGAQVYLQSWFRDPPASFGSGLSNALTFALLP